MNKSDKINVLIYGLPNTSGGGYSVLENLYEDIKNNRDKNPDIHWHFIVGRKGFINAENITIHDETKSNTTYFHRLLFNTFRIKKYIKKYHIATVIYINRSIRGVDVPSIISFHNVLPFYKCNYDVFDKMVDILKQRLINLLMIKSLKNAKYIVVPSKWIKNELIEKFDISENSIAISPIGTPEIASDIDEKKVQKDIDNNDCERLFIYPASGMRYKNHSVIVEASKILLKKGCNGFRVKFIGNIGKSRTMRKIIQEINMYNLPIEFVGYTNKQQLAFMYKKSVLIFPSKIETDGFPILESVACGGKILAADLPYAREALAEYRYCNYFDPDDALELAELMEHEIIAPTNVIVNQRSYKNNRPRSETLVPIIRAIVGEE